MLSDESKRILKNFMKGKVTEQQLKEHQAQLCWVEAMEFNRALGLMLAVCGIALKHFEKAEGK
jgi:hypothetical protein